jgi:hypothetical protein
VEYRSTLEGLGQIAKCIGIVVVAKTPLEQP